MGRFKPDMPDLCCDSSGKVIDDGTLVITAEEEYREAWWFRWPGKVIERHGRNAIVEFLGWGNRSSRRRRLPGRHLTLIDNTDTLAKLNKVRKRIENLSDDTAKRVKKVKL